MIFREDANQHFIVRNDGTLCDRKPTRMFVCDGTELGNSRTWTFSVTVNYKTQSFITFASAATNRISRDIFSAPVHVRNDAKLD